MTYKMIVFDWDGTVFDSTGLIADLIRLSCTEVWFTDPGEHAASYVIGMGLPQAFAMLVPQASHEQINQILERYRYHYLQQRNSVKLFKEVVPLLTSLRDLGVICTVATGKSRAGLNRTMAECQVAHFFAASRCADECFSKPHPQMLEQLLNEFSLAPNHALMIGDTTHDLNMAHALGVPAVSVQSGAHSLQLLQQVPHLKSFLSINEVAPWLISQIKQGSA